MKGSWTTSDRIVYSGMRPFDLKVGDKIIFPENTTESGAKSLKGKLHVGKVIGIYPYIFHIEYEVGVAEKYIFKRSFPKSAYQIGEISKYESY